MVPCTGVFAACTLALAIGCAPATPTTKATGSAGLRPIRPDALQSAVDARARELMVPGAMVLLRTPQGDLPLAFGTTPLGRAIPPSSGTRFRIASNTKTMTAAVILQLAQEGRLNLDDPVSELDWGPTRSTSTEARAPDYNSFMDHDPTDHVTLVVRTNLTVSLDQAPTANALMLKVLDQIYVVSPLAPHPAPVEAARIPSP